MASFDVMLVPGVGVQPFPWSMNYPETVDGEVIANYMGWLHLTSSLTVAGLPVVTLPMGHATEACRLVFRS